MFEMGACRQLSLYIWSNQLLMPLYLVVVKNIVNQSFYQNYQKNIKLIFVARTTLPLPLVGELTGYSVFFAKSYIFWDVTLISCLAYSFWKWRRHVPPKHQLTFKGLNGDVSQKIATTARTSNRTPYSYSHGVWIRFVVLFLSAVRHVVIWWY
jgi:hypothetical protein